MRSDNAGAIMVEIGILQAAAFALIFTLQAVGKRNSAKGKGKAKGKAKTKEKVVEEEVRMRETQTQSQLHPHRGARVSPNVYKARNR